MCVVCESNNTRVKLTGDPDHPTTPSPSLKKNLQVPLASPSEKRYIIYIRTYRICKLEGSPFSHNVLSLSLVIFFFAFCLSKYWKERGYEQCPLPEKYWTKVILVGIIYGSVHVGLRQGWPTDEQDNNSLPATRYLLHSTAIEHL